MNTKVEQAAALTLKFIKATIVGHERGMFRSQCATEPPHLVELFKSIDLTELTFHTENFIKGCTVSYFNKVYDSLLAKDDPYVSGVFDGLMSCINHSPVCIVGILFSFCTTVHLNLNRKLFLNRKKLEYLEDYSASVSLQIDLVLNNEMKHYLIKLWSHECSGEKVLPALPPGKKMFYTASTSDSQNGKTPIPIKVLHSRCDICGKQTNSKCSKCKSRNYCSRQCQITDWPAHKTKCIAKEN